MYPSTRSIMSLIACFIGILPSLINSQDLHSHPVLEDFDDILFIERSIRADLSGSEYEGDHMNDQYHAFNARKGGGLYILKNFKSSNPQRIDVVEGLRVPSGTNEGMPLSDGAFLSPDLSYDGKTIVFAWTSGGTDPWVRKNRFNLFSVNVDGTDLKRLTDINEDDFDPCWLPNGRIAFVSTRRGGFGRCHPHAKPTSTLYSMKADGSDLYCISYHETNEWHPSVDNNGMIVYSRWDYIDRDSDIAHHIWQCFPDGRDPRSWHGNYPYPWSTISGTESFNRSSGDGRRKRPWIEQNIRAIPNTAGKYVATASLHHGQAFGSLIMIDLNEIDDNLESQLTRLTTDVPYPEAEVGTEQSWEQYGTPWPFTEKLYLCNYKNGIYFYDAGSGTKELIYRSTANKFRPIDPIPVIAREKPPVLAIQTCQGELLKPDSPNATLSVMDVRITDLPFPQGVTIKEMRIVQIFPKTTPLVNNPKVHYGEQGICRMSIGTVPVESDGSVYCKAPVGKEIYFQLLDENGMAVQSMRSGTYLHAGETMSCIGCHEDKYSAPPNISQRIALQRPPSEITPEPPGLEPVSYYRTVKPVFDAKCVKCHQKEFRAPNMSYESLKPYAFYFDGGGNGSIMDPVIGGSRTIPGLFGARFSRLVKEGPFEKNHHDCTLTDEERRRITLWLDLGSIELGAYHDVSRQKAGALVWPEIDSDPSNPQGLENRFATSNRTTIPDNAVNHGKIGIADSRLIVEKRFTGKYSIQICSIGGRMINKIESIGPGTAEMSLHRYVPGVYVLSVSHVKEKYSKRIFLK